MEDLNIEELNIRFEHSSIEELLEFFMKNFMSRVALSSSLSAEDQVITDIMLKLNPKARIFTLDTGRLFPETYSLIDRTNMTYGTKIEVFFPDNELVQKMVNEHGMNPFYESIEKRHMCCEVRKLEPLRRALSTVDVWICGLRKDQSITRHDMSLIELDSTTHGKIKVNPLINWSEKDVWDYIHTNGVPYNKLHDNGFPSIGCQPCTRAVSEGEDVRSGRWWWEDPDHRECGLHCKEDFK